MSDRYTVINKEEPHGQSVAENGIPCTARHCVTQLNGLFQDNEKLELKIIGLESKLKSIKFFIKTKKEEFEEQSFTIHKECTGSLRDLNYTNVISDSVNLHTLRNITRILNELIEMIEDGEFDITENPKKVKK